MAAPAIRVPAAVAANPRNPAHTPFFGQHCILRLPQSMQAGEQPGGLPGESQTGIPPQPSGPHSSLVTQRRERPAQVPTGMQVLDEHSLSLLQLAKSFSPQAPRMQIWSVPQVRRSPRQLPSD